MAASIALNILRSGSFMLLGLMSILTSSVAAEPPDKYFSGPQLVLAEAVSNGDLDRVKQLASLIDLNKPALQDMTLLFFTLQTAYGEKKEQLKILSEMVRLGADPLQKVPDMGSVAQIVARSDSPLYMKALLDGGMSPNAIAQDTPIIFGSASEHSFNVLKFLVNHGADVNQKDTLGQNVLIEALAGMQLDQVEWLLQHGANPSLITVNGWQFGNMLENIIKGNGNGKSQTTEKLEEIRRLAISKGMKWPPASYQ